MSRRAMLDGDWQPSICVWEDAVGKVHTISKGEGGEQGDAIMPVLFALGQHEALQRACAKGSICWHSWTIFT